MCECPTIGLPDAETDAETVLETFLETDAENPSREDPRGGRYRMALVTLGATGESWKHPQGLATGNG